MRVCVCLSVCGGAVCKGKSGLAPSHLSGFPPAAGLTGEVNQREAVRRQERAGGGMAHKIRHDALSWTSRKISTLPEFFPIM